MVENTLPLNEYLWQHIGCTEALTAEYIRVALTDITLFDVKQADYGSGNISKFGEKGVLVRASDKIERLVNLLRKGTDAKNEAIDDSWADLSVYGVIARMVRRGQWK